MSIWKGLIQQNSWGFTLIHTLHGKIILSIVDQNYQAVYVINMSKHFLNKTTSELYTIV